MFYLHRKIINNIMKNKELNEDKEIIYKYVLVEKESNKIPKPFDDLVDAYFLCNYLFKLSNH